MNVHLELLHGAENAFGLLDARTGEPGGPDPYARIARAVGLDGLLVVLPATSRADVRMRMFNPDGSEAEMCGNGIRCLARYIDERDAKSELIVETLAGPIGSRVLSRSPYTIETQMGVPQVGSPGEIEADGRTWRYLPVSVGNPHAVVFVDDPDRIDVARVGREIETAPRFPGGTNVHFARAEGTEVLRVRHWERGAGATQACGTGIVASAAAGIAQGIG